MFDPARTDGNRGRSEASDVPVGDLGPEPWPGFRAGMPPPPPAGPAPPRGSGPPERRRSKTATALLASLLAVAVLASALVFQNLWSGGRLLLPGRLDDGVVAGPANAGRIARQVIPAVVNITSFSRPFGHEAIRGDAGLTPFGTGTGMILTSSGEVLTNNHVIDGAYEIRVSIRGRADPVTATVIGVDPSHDVALLRLPNAAGLPTVTIGDASELTRGDRVVAIGNSFGQGISVTKGTVAGLNRSITANGPASGPEHLTGMIQMEGDIRPGDSGGPLVNTSGEVVGMITAGAGHAGTDATRVGFAIPTDTAIPIVEQIRAGRESSTILLGERGFLGVAVRELDATTAAELGVTSGALVVGVQRGGPAEGVGITAPAVIVSVDGEPIGSADALGPPLHAHTPGEQVQVTWVDRSGRHTATVTLTDGPAV